MNSLTSLVYHHFAITINHNEYLCRLPSMSSERDGNSASSSSSSSSASSAASSIVGRYFSFHSCSMTRLIGADKRCLKVDKISALNPKTVSFFLFHIKSNFNSFFYYSYHAVIQVKLPKNFTLQNHALRNILWI